MIKNKIRKDIKITPIVLIMNDISELDDIILTLNKHIPIIINVIKLEEKVQDYIINFLCGYVYALNGDSKKIDHGIYRFFLS